MSDRHLHESALCFYARHQGEHLAPDRKRLIERCAEHLSDTFDASMRAAEDTALRAWGEIESRGQRCYIDLDRSTSYAVFVQDPDTGVRKVFTVNDLVALMKRFAVTEPSGALRESPPLEVATG